MRLNRNIRIGLTIAIATLWIASPAFAVKGKSSESSASNSFSIEKKGQSQTAEEPKVTSSKKHGNQSQSSGKNLGSKGFTIERGDDPETLSVRPHGLITRRHPTPSPIYRGRFWVDIDADRSVYDIGDSVRIHFEASDDCHVYIFNTDAAGITRQIFPNYYDRDNYVRGGRRYSIPDYGYALVAEGPSGRESIQIVAHRKQWRALERWGHFDRHDPFPLRSLSPSGMRSQIEDEAKSLEQAPQRIEKRVERRGGRLHYYCMLLAT